jgi:hypothetical protein
MDCCAWRLAVLIARNPRDAGLADFSIRANARSPSAPRDFSPRVTASASFSDSRISKLDVLGMGLVSLLQSPALTSVTSAFAGTCPRRSVALGVYFHQQIKGAGGMAINHPPARALF